MKKLLYKLGFHWCELCGQVIWPLMPREKFSVADDIDEDGRPTGYWGLVHPICYENYDPYKYI